MDVRRVSADFISPCIAKRWKVLSTPFALSKYHLERQSLETCRQRAERDLRQVCCDQDEEYGDKGHVEHDDPSDTLALSSLFPWLWTYT
jgi:hypothetical protein